MGRLACTVLLLSSWLAGFGCARASPGPPFQATVGGDDAAAPTETETPAASDYDAAATPTAGPAPASSPPVATPAVGDDAGDATDAAAPLPLDSLPDGACPFPLAPGALLIDELLIESVAGTGDYGEWVEVKSNRSCAVDLRGLHGECPKGAKVVTVDVVDDVWLPAGGSFVLADSVDPVQNHYLPGTVVGWRGQPGDVLRNKGTTVTLSLAGTVIDTLTYPALALTVGASLEFPGDCDAGERADFTRWKTAEASWFPGFRGTPNAPNSDVACE